MRSLTELAGLLLSNLHTISATHPSFTRFNRTNGVLPIKSRMESAILAAAARCVVVVAVTERMDEWMRWMLLLRMVLGITNACVALTKKRDIAPRSIAQTFSWYFCFRLTVNCLVVIPSNATNCLTLDFGYSLLHPVPIGGGSISHASGMVWD